MVRKMEGGLGRNLRSGQKRDKFMISTRWNKQKDDHDGLVCCTVPSQSFLFVGIHLSHFLLAFCKLPLDFKLVFIDLVALVRRWVVQLALETARVGDGLTGAAGSGHGRRG